jgi:hypothetical protein
MTMLTLHCGHVLEKTCFAKRSSDIKATWIAVFAEMEDARPSIHYESAMKKHSGSPPLRSWLSVRPIR